MTHKYLRSKSFCISNKISSFHHRIHSFTNRHNKELYNTFGYVCNPSLTTYQNKFNVLANTPTKIYFSTPDNLSFHNLCQNSQIPLGTNNLLGLGHKFIPQRYKSNIDIEKCIDSFCRDARIKHFFFETDETSMPPPPNDSSTSDTTTETTFNIPPRLYIKSKWEPPKGNDILESRLETFANKLRDHISKQHPKKSTNLNKLQLHALNQLQKNNDIIVLLADKNLGPVVMDKSTYINRVLSDHLNDITTYQQIEKYSAIYTLNKLRAQLKQLFLLPPPNQKPTNLYSSNQYKIDRDNLQDYERHFLGTNLYDESSRIPIFYGLIKVHKNPWKIRPVVSCSGSLLAAISTWIDHKLQPLRTHIKSYIKDSDDLLLQLQQLPLPPDGIKLGTSDAVSMYTNIDTRHNIHTVEHWLQKISQHLPPNFPSTLLLEAIKIVMENNIFRFGERYFIQKTGTAMGTPCACILATIYYSIHEEYLISKYSKHLLYFKRFIDDCFYIWKLNGDTSTSIQIYNNFKQEMNDYGLLRWTHSPLNHKTTFLDLTISYSPTKKHLTFQTFQKPENLYLYLTPNSSHPPGVLKSLIFGLLRKYKIQNTHESDFRQMLSKLFTRLLARGHTQESLLPIFNSALLRLSLPPNVQQEQEPTNNNLYFKIQYHPKSISRKTIQQFFHETCSSPSPIQNQDYDNNRKNTRDILFDKKLTIAYSRDKNLRDLLIPSDLKNYKNKN